jgi:hypothetical protein
VLTARHLISLGAASPREFDSAGLEELLSSGGPAA